MRASPTLPVMEPADYQLRQISLYQQPKGRHPGGHAIPAYCERIELVTAGYGAVLDEDHWRPIGPGDLLWNQPGHFTIGRSDFENPYRCLSVLLQGPHPGGSGMPRFSKWGDMEEVDAFCRETLQAFVRESFPTDLLCAYLVARLRFRVQLHLERAPASLPKPLLKGLRWLKENHTRPCTMEELAAALGWSTGHLFAMFSRHLGATPHQILIRERVRTAKARLVSSAAPIKQIAVESGFFDASAFSNRFKAETGLTPKEYRLRNTLS